MFIVKKKAEIVRFGLFLAVVCLMVYYVAARVEMWRTSRESANSPRPVNGEVAEGANLAPLSDGRDFFADFRVERDRERGAHRETLKEIMDNPNLDGEAKKEAGQLYLALGRVAAQESTAERLVKAGGFEDAVVSIFEGSAQVVVKAASVSEKQFHQIVEIVNKTTGIKPVSIQVKWQER